MKSGSFSLVGFYPTRALTNLIDAYLESVRSCNGTSLWIGGPSDQESTQQIVIEGVRSTTVLNLAQASLTMRTLELQVKAADWVVLPYSSGLNSGVAIYALSCGTRAHSSRQPSNEGDGTRD